MSLPPSAKPPILTVFLSSTSEDLGQHRARVFELLDRLDRVKVVRQEQFSARGQAIVPFCTSSAADADILVVVVAHRYGWVPAIDEEGDGTRSITQLEVAAAEAAQRPVLAFLVDPSYPWPHSADASAGLATFRHQLESSYPRDLFTTPDDLAGKVVAAVSNQIQVLDRAHDTVATRSAAGRINLYQQTDHGGRMGAAPGEPAELFRRKDRPLAQGSSPPRGRVVGRDRDLDELHRAVREEPLVQVRGPSGIGKTVLLKAFSNDERIQRLAPGGIVGVDALEAGNTIDGLVQRLFRKVYEPRGPTRYCPAPDEYEALFGDLEAVVVLDGLAMVDQPADDATGRQARSADQQRQVLEDILRSSRMVVGTIRKEFAVQSLRLDPLQLDDAARLFTSLHEGEQTDPADERVRRIVEGLGGHPQAIVLAARLELPLADLAAIASSGRGRDILSGLDRMSDGDREAALALAGLGNPPVGVAGLAALTDDELVEAFQLTGVLAEASSPTHLTAAVAKAARSSADVERATAAAVARLGAWAQEAPREDLVDEAPLLLAAAAWAVENDEAGTAMAVVARLAPSLCVAGLWARWREALGLARVASALLGPTEQGWVSHELAGLAWLDGHRWTAIRHLLRARRLRVKGGDRAGLALTRQNLRFLAPVWPTALLALAGLLLLLLIAGPPVANRLIGDDRNPAAGGTASQSTPADRPGTTTTPTTIRTLTTERIRPIDISRVGFELVIADGVDNADQVAVDLDVCGRGLSLGPGPATGTVSLTAGQRCTIGVTGVAAGQIDAADQQASVRVDDGLVAELISFQRRQQLVAVMDLVSGDRPFRNVTSIDRTIDGNEKIRVSVSAQPDPPPEVVTVQKRLDGPSQRAFAFDLRCDRAGQDEASTFWLEDGESSQTPVWAGSTCVLGEDPGELAVSYRTGTGVTDVDEVSDSAISFDLTDDTTIVAVNGPPAEAVEVSSLVRLEPDGLDRTVRLSLDCHAAGRVDRDQASGLQPVGSFADGTECDATVSVDDPTDIALVVEDTPRTPGEPFTYLVDRADPIMEIVVTGPGAAVLTVDVAVEQTAGIPTPVVNVQATCADSTEADSFAGAGLLRVLHVAPGTTCRIHSSLPVTPDAGPDGRWIVERLGGVSELPDSVTVTVDGPTTVRLVVRCEDCGPPPPTIVTVALDHRPLAAGAAAMPTATLTCTLGTDQWSQPVPAGTTSSMTVTEGASCELPAVSDGVLAWVDNAPRHGGTFRALSDRSVVLRSGAMGPAGPPVQLLYQPAWTDPGAHRLTLACQDPIRSQIPPVSLSVPTGQAVPLPLLLAGGPGSGSGCTFGQASEVAAAATPAPQVVPVTDDRVPLAVLLTMATEPGAQPPTTVQVMVDCDGATAQLIEVPVGEISVLADVPAGSGTTACAVAPADGSWMLEIVRRPADAVLQDGAISVTVDSPTLLEMSGRLAGVVVPPPPPLDIGRSMCTTVIAGGTALADAGTAQTRTIQLGDATGTADPLAVQDETITAVADWMVRVPDPLPDGLTDAMLDRAVTLGGVAGTPVDVDPPLRDGSKSWLVYTAEVAISPDLTVVADLAPDTVLPPRYVVEGITVTATVTSATCGQEAQVDPVVPLGFIFWRTSPDVDLAMSSDGGDSAGAVISMGDISPPAEGRLSRIDGELEGVPFGLSQPFHRDGPGCPEPTGLDNGVVAASRCGPEGWGTAAVVLPPDIGTELHVRSPAQRGESGPLIARPFRVPAAPRSDVALSATIDPAEDGPWLARAYPRRDRFAPVEVRVVSEADGPASGVEVAITGLPDGVAASPSQGEWAGGRWSAGTVDAGGATITFDLSPAELYQVGVISAEVAAMNERDVDSEPAGRLRAGILEDDEAQLLVLPTFPVVPTAAVAGRVWNESTVDGVAVFDTRLVNGVFDTGPDGSESGRAGTTVSLVPAGQAVAAAACPHSELTVQTDANGLYAVDDVPVGTYDVVAHVGEGQVATFTVPIDGMGSRAAEFAPGPCIVVATLDLGPGSAELTVDVGVIPHDWAAVLGPALDQDPPGLPPPTMPTPTTTTPGLPTTDGDPPPSSVAGPDGSARGDGPTSTARTGGESLPLVRIGFLLVAIGADILGVGALYRRRLRTARR